MNFLKNDEKLFFKTCPFYFMFDVPFIIQQDAVFFDMRERILFLLARRATIIGQTRTTREANKPISFILV